MFTIESKNAISPGSSLYYQVKYNYSMKPVWTIAVDLLFTYYETDLVLGHYGQCVNTPPEKKNSQVNG